MTNFSRLYVQTADFMGKTYFVGKAEWGGFAHKVVNSAVCT